MPWLKAGKPTANCAFWILMRSQVPIEKSASMKTPTPIPEEYDVVVLGSGEAGKYIAWTLAKKGMRAVVIERKYVGGSCPNIACLPSKNIIHSAKVASYFWRSGEFGITKDNCQIHMSGCVIASGRWLMDCWTCTSLILRRAGRNCLWGLGASSDPKRL